MFSNARMRLPFIAFACGLLSGCVSYEHVTEFTTAKLNNPNFTGHIVTGETEASWLNQHLGKPARITTTASDKQIWQYDYLVNEATRMHVLPLVAVRLENTQRSTYFFEIAQGRVSNYWQGGKP